MERFTLSLLFFRLKESLGLGNADPIARKQAGVGAAFLTILGGRGGPSLPAVESMR